MENFAELIEESIELELNAAGLYALFHFAYPEDAPFWWQLHLEERNHAALLRSIENTFLPLSICPEGLVLPPLQQLKKTNDRLRGFLADFRNKPPAREDAFHIALEVETSAGEIHFQKFAEQQHENKIDKIFGQLIRDDKDHLQRIQQYMLDKDIKNKDINI
jgi:hypothetical protein